MQKLRSLIVNIIQILDNALELHGKLAPSEVQPLHKLLVERFNHFRDNLSCWSKVRRQKSESIINTPLPPLPISSTPRNDYDHDETYSQIKSSNFNDFCNINRRSLDLPEIASQPPPRPSKGSFEYNNSPEVPPKLISGSGPSSAPPLPPRHTPDKRSSNPQLFDSFQRTQYEIVDVYEDSSEIDFDNDSDMIHRDSGISNNSIQQEANNPYTISTNSLPMMSGYNVPFFQRIHMNTNPLELTHEDIQQHALATFLLEPNSAQEPPVLPPKIFTNQNNEDNESYTNSDSTSGSPPLPPIPPIKQQMHLTIENFSTVPCCDFEANSEIAQCCVPNEDNEEIESEEICFCDNPPPSNQTCC